MDDAFVFYAYWNGNQIRDLFEGLVSVTNGSGFVQLAAFLVVTGMVACLLIGAVKGYADMTGTKVDEREFLLCLRGALLVCGDRSKGDGRH